MTRPRTVHDAKPSGGVRRWACAALAAAAVLGLAPASGMAQQTQPQAQPSDAAACFTATAPAAIVTACNAALARPANASTPDQTGLALQRRGAAFVALGRTADAIADFRRMIAAGFKPHEAHASIASLEYAEGRLDAAEQSYREALKLNASYGLALTGLGQTLLARGRAAEALPYFDRAIATSDQDTAALLGKGVALQASGDLDGAIRNFDTALRIDPRLVPALYLRAQAHGDKGATDKSIADADAAVALATGDEKVRALSYRGRLRNNAKRYDAAIADCTEAASLAGSLDVKDAKLRAAPFVCLGLARQNRGLLAEARQSLDEALKWDPSDATALAGRGNVFFSLGRHDAAIADFKAALVADPTSKDALRYLGFAYADKGDLPNALAVYERAIKADARDPWPHMLRAIALAVSGDRKGATADINAAFGITGQQSSDAHVANGTVLYQLDDLEAARTELETAIRLDPANGQAHAALARLLLRQNRLADARRELDTARRLLQSDVTLNLTRGLLALAERDYGTAVREITASIALDPAHAEGYVARGEAYEGQGRPDLAAADYRAAASRLAIDLDGKRAKARAVERLAALSGGSSSTGTPSDPRKLPTAQPGQAATPEPSLYCRAVESVLVHSRRYSGVDFDAGCGHGRTR